MLLREYRFVAKSILDTDVSVVARQPIGLNRAAHGTPGNNLNIPKTQGYCPPDSRKARAGNTQNVPRLRQRGQSG